MKFIFIVRVKPGHTEEEYINAWKTGSNIIQKEPGAQGTKLYRKVGKSGEFIAIATWESKDARDKAFAHLKTVDAQTSELLDKHKEYGETTVLGFFEEPAKAVYPS